MSPEELITAVVAMCMGSLLLSVFIIAFALNLAYLGRRYFYGIRDLG